MPQTSPTIEALLAFKLNGMRPFDPTATDLAYTSLEQAHALAIMLGAAFGDCEETSETNGEIIRAAFNGIARLIALSAFAGEAA